MKNPDELRQENDMLRDRLSRLSAAVLRVSASLDLSTVLQEVVDSARALTCTRPPGQGHPALLVMDGQISESEGLPSAAKPCSRTERSRFVGRRLRLADRQRGEGAETIRIDGK